MPVAADIYYHVYDGGGDGRGLPVILLHGAGGMHLSWPSEVRRLKGFNIFALDLPGHGKSAGAGSQSITGYAMRLAEWMQAIQISRAVWTGHSMGSAIALTLALDFPELVSALGLIGGGARLRVAPDLLERVSLPATFQSGVDGVTRASFADSAPAQLVQQAAKRMADTRQSVLHGDFLACDAFDVTDRLGDIHCPTWVACGAEDRMTPVRYSQYLADQIPTARLEIIPNAGHMVMLEQPQAVAMGLRDFLTTIQ
jgi:pimeloyl-ACP methyl ester carboxylesterase